MKAFLISALCLIVTGVAACLPRQFTTWIVVPRDSDQR
jgi:hypothetical protein